MLQPVNRDWHHENVLLHVAICLRPMVWSSYLSQSNYRHTESAELVASWHVMPGRPMCPTFLRSSHSCRSKAEPSGCTRSISKTTSEHSGARANEFFSCKKHVAPKYSQHDSTCCATCPATCVWKAYLGGRAGLWSCLLQTRAPGKTGPILSAFHDFSDLQCTAWSILSLNRFVPSYALI